MKHAFWPVAGLAALAISYAATNVQERGELPNLFGHSSAATNQQKFKPSYIRFGNQRFSNGQSEGNRTSGPNDYGHAGGPNSNGPNGMDEPN